MASAAPVGNGVIRAVFSMGKCQCTVTVTETGNITWVKHSKGGEENGPRVTVPKEEILSVSVIDKKDTNSSVGFKLSYIKHKKKNVLRQTHDCFYGTSEDCQLIATAVQDVIDSAPRRPRKALVFVNPFCGRKMGVKLYETQVAPVFSNCGLRTNVIVTERAQHAEEVLSVYDLSTIDCIVTVGGDGSYHAVANGLLKRIQNEAGVDLNNPEATLKRVSLPIGVIAGGSANLFAKQCHGTDDAETAALTIIKGHRRGANVFSVFADENWLCFAIMGAGYGLSSEQIPRTEELRYLGIGRYLVALLETYIMKPRRVLDVTFEFLKLDMAGGTSTDLLNTIPEVELATGTTSAPSVSDSNAAESQSATCSDSSAPTLAWHKERQDIIDSVGFSPDFYGDLLFGQQFTTHGAALFYTKPCTRWQMIKLHYRHLHRKQNMLEGGVVQYRSHQGFRVKLNQPNAPDGSTNRHHVMHVDGEPYFMTEPAFEVRLHTCILKAFCDPEGVWRPDIAGQTVRFPAHCTETAASCSDQL